MIEGLSYGRSLATASWFIQGDNRPMSEVLLQCALNAEQAGRHQAVDQLLASAVRYEKKETS